MSRELKRRLRVHPVCASSRGAGRVSFRHHRDRIPATLRGEIAGASPHLPAACWASLSARPYRWTGRDFQADRSTATPCATWRRDLRCASRSTPAASSSTLAYRRLQSALVAASDQNGVSISSARRKRPRPNCRCCCSAPIKRMKRFRAGALAARHFELALAAEARPPLASPTALEGDSLIAMRGSAPDYRSPASLADVRQRVAGEQLRHHSGQGGATEGRCRRCRRMDVRSPVHRFNRRRHAAGGRRRRGHERSGPDAPAQDPDAPAIETAPKLSSTATVKIIAPRTLTRGSRPWSVTSDR